MEIAWNITREMKAAGDLVSDVDERLFGKSREFLTPRSRTQGRTPLVNNIVAAAVFVDHVGRVYAFADPSDLDEDMRESPAVPQIPLTDRLFVAITNQARHNAEELDDETQVLPQPGDRVMLTHLKSRARVLVTIDAVQEPTAELGRISSALVTLDGLVRVIMEDGLSPHAIFESALRLSSAGSFDSGL